MHPSVRRAKPSPARAFRNRKRPLCPVAVLQPGPSCMASNRHCRPRRCARSVNTWRFLAAKEERRPRVARIEPTSYLGRVSGTSRGECNLRKGKKPLNKSALSRASRRMPEFVSRPSAKETLRLVLARLEDMKAEDSVTIDLTTGHSHRHVGAVADHVVKDMKEAGVPGVRVEGMRQGDWVLIDAGDVIVHVFRPEVRSFYNLEKMWSSDHAALRQSN